MRTIHLIGCALIGVSLASIACDICDFAQLAAAPVPTAAHLIVDHRSLAALVLHPFRGIAIQTVNKKTATVMPSVNQRIAALLSRGKKATTSAPMAG